MLINNIKTTLRQLMKHKIFTLINIIGLAFGIAMITMIGQFLYFEFSYDRFHKNIDHIYQLVDKAENSYLVDYRIRDKILENIPQVKDACLYNPYSIEVNYQNKSFEFDYLLSVDPSFFRIFNFPFVSGDANNALSDINSVILTESIAQRIFGNESPLGKSITLDHEYEMFVTGIVKDFPENSSFSGEIFMSAENTKQKRIRYGMSCLSYDGVDDSQCRYPFRIFLQLHPNADAQSVEQKICSLFTGDDYRFPNTLALSPFKQSYLHNQYAGSRLQHGNFNLLKILTYIGLLVLALAIINYINLTTAAYKYRLKEIGVKKCVGVRKQSIIFQILGESLIICFIASLAGIFLVEICLPYFNQFVEKSIDIHIFSNIHSSLLFIMFIIFLSFSAGLYPALLLSRITPLQLIQSKMITSNTRSMTRNILNIFQFTVSIGLIAVLFIMMQQIDYVKHKNLGFNSERLLNIKIHPKMNDLRKPLVDRLLQYAHISDICLTNGIPGRINMSMGGFKTIIIDDNFLKTFGLKIIEGRNLMPGDVNKACLINESALSKFENGNFQGNEINNCNIVGVVSDFHFSSLHNKIAPLGLMYYKDWGYTHISLKLTGPINEGMDYIRKAWTDICPDYLFSYNFYDDWFDSMYKKEENLAKLISIFAILAIVVSCLGLFGLVLFAAEQRTKEIGIRKVLGSSVIGIMFLLIQGFIKWILLANIIAYPLAYFAMNKWLQNFAYKITIEWWMFLLAGLVALIIALLIVSWQTVKAATANPVEAMRYE